MKLTFLIFLLSSFGAFCQVDPSEVEHPNQNPPKSDSIINFCQCEAQFPGGIKAMKEHFNNYPTYVKEGEKNEKSTQKKGVVTFAVEIDGRLTEIAIRREVSPELDDLMLRIVEEMPRWIPACGCDGEGPVRSRVWLPFTFYFPEEEKP